MKRIDWTSLGINRLFFNRWETWRQPLRTGLDLFRFQFLLGDREWDVLEEIGGAQCLVRCYLPTLNAYSSTIVLDLGKPPLLISSPIPAALKNLSGATYFQCVWRLKKNFEIEEFAPRLSIEEAFRAPD